jgi:hypothetical protein
MDVKYFCPNRGSEQLPFNVFADKVRQAGFDGVEMSLPFEEAQKGKIIKGLEGSGLLFIAQHCETMDPKIEVHRKNYERRLRNLASVNPLFINTQTGWTISALKKIKAS